MILIDVIHMAYSCSFFSYIAILFLAFWLFMDFFFFGHFNHLTPFKKCKLEILLGKTILLLNLTL